MLNVERFQIIRNAIADHPELYDQKNLGNPHCDTPGCLIGWYQTKFRFIRNDAWTDEGVMAGLGLPETTSLLSSYWPVRYARKAGFKPGRYASRLEPKDCFDPTADECLKVLDALIAAPEEWFEIIKRS